MRAGFRVVFWLSLTISSLLNEPALAGDTVPCQGGDGRDEVFIVPTADVPCHGDQSGFDVKLGAIGGGGKGSEFGGVTGQVLLPFEGINFQFDGLAGRTGGNWMGQATGHLFLSDGAQSQFGLYGGWAGLNDFSVYRAGLETSWQFDAVVFEAVAGWQSEGRHGLFLDTRAALQVTDEAEVYAGYSYDDGSIGKLGFAYELPSQQSTRFFAEGSVNDDKHVSVQLGVSFSLSGLAGGSDANCAPAPKKFANHWWLPQSVRSGKGARAAAAGGPVAQQCSALPAAQIEALPQASSFCVATYGDTCRCFDYTVTGTYTGTNTSTCNVTGANSYECF